MLNDIPTQSGRFQYAEDTSIVVTAQNHSDLSRNCQAACAAITKWASYKAPQSKLLQNGFTLKVDSTSPEILFSFKIESQGCKDYLNIASGGICMHNKLSCSSVR